MGGVDEARHCDAGLLVALQQVQQQGMADPHPCMQLLRHRFDQLVEGGLRVVHETLRWLLPAHRTQFLLVPLVPGEDPGVLHLVFRCLGYDIADGVETGPASAPRDLVELTAAQYALPPAVELCQGTEQYGTDGDVDPHP